MRPQEDIDAENFENRRFEEMAAKGKAEADFVKAIKLARKGRTDAGLDCSFDAGGNAVFTVEQGMKAACHGREDAAAGLMLQLFVMKRLDRNRNFMWAIIALLLYIAIQFK